MEYSISVNQVKSVEWGLSMGESLLFSYLVTVGSWAKCLPDSPEFKWISNSKLAEELPLVCAHQGSARRHMASLEIKGLLNRIVVANKSYFKITQKGLGWRSATLSGDQKAESKPNQNEQAKPIGSPKTNESVRPKPNESVRRSYTPLNHINQDQEKPMPEDVLKKKWAGYLESRKEKRRTMNDAALDLAVENIGKVVKEGYSLSDVLDALIVGGWQTVTVEYMEGKAKRHMAPEQKKKSESAQNAPKDFNQSAYEAANAEKLSKMMAGIGK